MGSIKIRKGLILGSITLISLVFLGIALYGFMYSKIPGQAGYGFKVNYLEEALEVFRPNAVLEANYQLSLLERRLDEIKRLNEEESIDEGDLQYFKEETIERKLELVALLAKEEGFGITTSEVIDYLHRLATILRAIETTTEGRDSFRVIEEDLEDARREAFNIFADRAEQFVAQNSEEDIKSYITALLQKVLSEVETKKLNRRLSNDVEEYVRRAQQDIVNGDGARALRNIGQAYMQIRVASYLGTTEVEPSMPERTEKTITGTSTSQP